MYWRRSGKYAGNNNCEIKPLIYGLANDITVEAFSSLSLSWKSTFSSCLMSENVNQNKNGEMIISRAKAINKATARAERCEEILPPPSTFPLFLSLRFMLSLWKLITLGFMLQTRIFSHITTRCLTCIFCYHFHTESRAPFHSHSHFFLRDATGRVFLWFSGDSFLPDLQAHNRLVV